ncbi:hypothetical protein R76696_01221 [Ralstonia mannitolilytica]|nr:hypothetical protein R76696_01221 [Ralstonia mannitolilytica]
MKCDRRSAVHRTERPRYAPAVRAIRLLARFRRPKVARSKYCSCEWNDGEHAGQARGGPARGMRMMPETPGMCTRPGAAHVPAADSVPAASAAYPFLRKHDATPHASRCVYPFLRVNSQKWVRSEGRFYTLGIGLGRTRFCEPTRSSTVPVSAVRRRFAAQAPNPFLRSGLPLRRTRFCGAARRNGYAGAAGERRKPLANKAFYPQKQVRRFARAGQDRSAARPIVGSFSDESCEDGPPRRTQPCCTVLVPPRASAETGTPTFHRTRSKRVLALLQIATVCGRRNRPCARARRFGYAPR